MISIPLPPIQFSDDINFSFPNSPCCNCGIPGPVSVVVQETTLTKYIVVGGTEITFKLPLPYCASCAATAKRTPKNIVHRILLFLLAFSASWLTILILGDVAYTVPWLMEYMMPIAIGFSAAVVGLVLLASRPKGDQTSHFQAVRIRKLKREFVSGNVVGIVFSFTNEHYKQLFVSLNRESVNRKTVAVV